MSDDDKMFAQLKEGIEEAETESDLEQLVQPCQTLKRSDEVAGRQLLDYYLAKRKELRSVGESE